MTAWSTASLTSPSPSYADTRFAVIRDPRPGTVVELATGSQLAVMFRRRLGPSRWHVSGLPGHLVLLADRGHEFRFLLFGCRDGAVPVRFERRHPEREMVHEVCELLVVPAPDSPDDRVSGAGARTSRSA